MMIQKTNYPWEGKVSIAINPKESKEFTVYVRIPNRNTSEIYTSSPQVNGLKSLLVNGNSVPVNIVDGYIPITRMWELGDVIDFELPMEVQKVTSDEKVAANDGEIALRYGPLIYCVEKEDQDITKTIGPDQIKPEWKKDLLGGIVVLNGKWNDNSPLLAIPYYARNNRSVYSGDDREDKSKVWITAD